MGFDTSTFRPCHHISGFMKQLWGCHGEATALGSKHSFKKKNMTSYFVVLVVIHVITRW